MSEPKRIGRPPGAVLPPEQQTKPRSIRLTEERWQTLRRLGVSEWLEPLLDRKRREMTRQLPPMGSCCLP